MKHIGQLEENECNFICKQISLKAATEFFLKNPKTFHKIRPGFQVSSLSKTDVGELLFKNRNNPSIHNFIDKVIDNSIKSIEKFIQIQITDNKENENAALLTALSESFFAKEVGIFFKLVDKQYSKEQIDLFQSSTLIINELKQSIKMVKEKSKDIENPQDKKDLIKLKADLKKAENKIKDLKKNNAEKEDREKQDKAIINQLQESIKCYESDLQNAKNELRKKEQEYKKSISDLGKTKSERDEFETKFKVAEKELNEIIAQKSMITKSIKIPKDMEEFIDSLQWNFDSLKIQAQESKLLKYYLASILFHGKPIVVSCRAITSLLKCITNSMGKISNFRLLSFSSTVSEQEIERLLNSESRIICLDNFLGNFDESVILGLARTHIDKIVFLTTTYAKTLRYLPPDFLQFCYYLNLNRTKAFNIEVETDEDPSNAYEEIEAKTFFVSDEGKHTRWINVADKILTELNFDHSLKQTKKFLISGEESLDQLLAFDILPYCIDVLEIYPFNISEQLDKYAGKQGRSAYSGLFGRWFS
jgi:hypothetical protein